MHAVVGSNLGQLWVSLGDTKAVAEVVQLEVDQGLPAGLYGLLAIIRQECGQVSTPLSLWHAVGPPTQAAATVMQRT